MIIKADRQQRNYNFLELIKGFNSAIDTYGSDGEMDNLYSFDFNPIGNENIDKLYDALVTDSDMDDENISLDLFYSDNGKYYFAKDSKITPPPTREEVAIIYSMLINGDFDLFLNDNEKSVLLNNINQFFDNLGEQPVDLYSFIDNKGRSKSRDNLAQIKPVFDVICKAITNNEYIRVSYFKDEEVKIILQPIGFEFSQLDERMRVKAFSDDGICRTFYLSYINNVEIIEEKPFNPFEYTQSSNKQLKFSFSNSYNLPERVSARFSDYHKDIRYNKKNNVITYIVDYEDNPKEQARILNRLLSLGKFITVESEESEILKAEARKALEQYK